MIGSNVPTRGGLAKGFEYADKWGCRCIQIYITQSRRWKVTPLSQNEIIAFKSAWEKGQVKIVIGHIPFLVNLASPDTDLRKKSVLRLVTEIDRAKQLGVPFLILHPGSNENREKGLKNIINSLDSVLDMVDMKNVKILLENMAGQGNTIGSSFDQLAFIMENIQKRNCFGICLDTCHAFAAGYDISEYDLYELFIETIEEKIGVKTINAIHISNSKTLLGSHIDRHAALNEGVLGLQVFHAIVRDKNFENIPKVLEIPERDVKSKSNLDLLRKLKEAEKAIV